MPPDIVYVLRRGEANHQLRYSLRSLVNVPHGRVWLAGYRPRWVRNVEHIPTTQRGSKWENSTLNLRAACEHPDVAEEFVLMNDDFFLLHPVDQVPVAHRGPIRGVEERFTGRKGAYLDSMRRTRRFLETLGYDDPLSYELHIPMPLTKAGVLKALAVSEHLDGAHKRSVYGVMHGIGGERMPDPKISRRDGQFDRNLTFLSTTQDSFHFGQVGAFIRARFPQPCRYEVGGVR